MFKHLKLIGICAITLTACSTVQPTLVATGGSRADATVEMSYEYNAFQTPQINLEQGRVEAEQRCKAWGYSTAEAFGGEQRQCNSYYNGGCMAYVATVTYQCLG